MSTLPDGHPLAACYVDLNDLTIILNCGETVSIVNLLDEDGEECGPDDAVVAIATNGKGWWTVPLNLARTFH